MKFTILSFIFLSVCLVCFSQDKEGFGDSSGPVTKIVKVFPNPATTQINIEVQSNNEQQYDFIVFNFMGKPFDEIKVNGRTLLNLSKYYSGIYIYQVRDFSGNILESGKFNVIK